MHCVKHKYTPGKVRDSNKRSRETEALIWKKKAGEVVAKPHLHFRENKVSAGGAICPTAPPASMTLTPKYVAQNDAVKCIA